MAADVEMNVEEGLDPALLAQGYRLLCVGYGRGRVVLDALRYDATLKKASYPDVSRISLASIPSKTNLRVSSLSVLDAHLTVEWRHIRRTRSQRP